MHQKLKFASLQHISRQLEHLVMTGAGFLSKADKNHSVIQKEKW